MSLKEWFGKGPKGDWVDIGAPKKKGKYQPCGRKSASKSKRAYPKCVPRSKARSMSKSQIKSAVQRKRARAQGVGGKPTNVKTIVSKKKTTRKNVLSTHFFLRSTRKIQATFQCPEYTHKNGTKHYRTKKNCRKS